MPKCMLKHHHSLPWTQTTHFINMIGYQQATGTLPHSAQAVSCTGILKNISMLMHLSQKY